MGDGSLLDPTKPTIEICLPFLGRVLSAEQSFPEHIHGGETRLDMSLHPWVPPLQRKVPVGRDRGTDVLNRGVKGAPHGATTFTREYYCCIIRVEAYIFKEITLL